MEFINSKNIYHISRDRERLALFGSVSPIRFIPLFMAILCWTECLELPLKLLLEGAEANFRSASLISASHNNYGRIHVGSCMLEQLDAATVCPVHPKISRNILCSSLSNRIHSRLHRNHSEKH